MSVSNQTPAGSSAKLGAFTLVMMTVVSVDSIRNLPVTALLGVSLIPFFLCAALTFLMPAALVSAELASGWPEQGGIYVWVRRAFGQRVGLLAIWLQWIENVIWYPALLSFVCSTLGYLISPHLAQKPGFLFGMVLACFGSVTWLNIKGIRFSAKFAEFCSVFGLLIPMAWIMLLGLFWWFKGYPGYLHMDAHHMLSKLHDSSVWSSLTGLVLSLCGIEIATVHARDVDQPRRTFPWVLGLSSVIICVTMVCGSLAISLVIPSEKMSLVAGVIQAFDIFLKAYHMHWLLPVMVCMLVCGGLGSLSNWVIAPVKGLMVAVNECESLPAWLSKENDQGAPVALLLIQAVGVALLTSLFLWVPSVNGSYWFLTVLAAELYMMMYVLMFLACLCLHYKERDTWRAFHIPGGTVGKWVCVCLGCASSLGTMVVGLISHPALGVSWGRGYTYAVLLGCLSLMAPPLLIRGLRQPPSEVPEALTAVASSAGG